MGFPKSTAKLGTDDFLDWQVALAQRLCGESVPIAVSAGANLVQFRQLHPTIALPFLADSVQEPGTQIGPLAGLLAGLEFAQQQNREWLFTLPIDMPFLPQNLLTQLAEGLGAENHRNADSNTPLPPKFVSAATTDHHPLVALWRATLVSDLKIAIANGTRRVRDFQQQHEGLIVKFARPADFININSRTDLEKYTLISNR